MMAFAEALAKEPFPWRKWYVTAPELRSLYGALEAYSGRWLIDWRGTLESTPAPWSTEATMALQLDDGPHSSSWHTGYSYEALVDAFTEYERLHARRRQGATLAEAPISAWRRPAVAVIVADKLKWRGIRTVEELRHRPHDFRMAIRSAVAECSLFRPQTAKALYDALADGPVLDPCAGWGCRALGALASKRVSSYIGFDPNWGLKPGHDAMIQFFKSTAGSTKSVRVVYAPFETAAPEAVAPGSMSLVLTSPPFYDLETYGKPDGTYGKPDGTYGQPDGTYGPLTGQSFTGQSFEAWASTWLQTFVNICATALRPGGFLAVHINDSPGAPSVRALHECAAKWPELIEKAPLAILGPKGQARPVWLWQKKA
jgi:hypothetical protein